MNEKTLLVGIDGGDWQLINPLLQKGRLPNLKKLVEEGVKAELKSTIPPQTIPAWTSMFTGKDPGDLGACDFSIPTDKKGNYKFATSDLWKGSFLWDYLSQEDFKVGVLNVPGTYPAYPINGVLVTGMLTPSKKPDVYPRDLELKDYRIDPEQGTILLDKEKFFKELLDINKKRFEAFKQIEKNNNFDLLIQVFSITDRVQHFLLNNSKVEETYKILDEEIGYFLEKFDNRVVVSDHGFSKLETPFFINNWLEKEGYLRRKLSFQKKFSEILPNFLKFNLLKILPDSFKKGDMPTSINFEKSKAFSICDNSISVREKRLVPEILRKLEKFDFLEAYSSSELYEVEENFPEILINPTSGSFAYKFFEKFFKKNISKEGDHRREGIFIAQGKAFNKDATIKSLDIKDLAPTLLYLFGLNLAGVKGEIRKEIFLKSEKETKKIKAKWDRREKVKRNREKEKVKERLKRLGYLE